MILARALRTIYQAPEGDQSQGGGVDPAAARTFVSAFVPDPKLIEGMDDTAVMAYHGQVSKTVDEQVKKARESYDWRKDVAGDNADALKTLERFASPKALYESYDQFRTRMSKGEIKAVTPFPDKGTPEQQTAWRAENGIPETADKYEIKPPNGIVIGEEDKPVLENFTAYAHSKNLPAAVVNEVAGWWFQEKNSRAEAARAAFETQKQETAAALGQEWGPEYKPNLNKIQGLLDSTIPTGEEGDTLKTLINNGIATNPLFARHYAALALQLNPGGTLVPGDRGAQESSVSDGIKKIEAFMKKDRNAYNKDEATQKQYREYLAAYERMTGKAWGGS